MAIVQSKILQAIVSCGGKATAKEIQELTGFRLDNIWGGCFHLINRRMIIKSIEIKKEEGLPPRKIVHYITRKSQKDRIKREIDILKCLMNSQ